MQNDTGIPLKELNVDGGASENNFLMKFQSDILNIPILRPEIKEITSLGIAQLAGLSIGFFKDMNEIEAKRQNTTKITPTMTEENRQELIKGWNKAVSRSRNWIEH